MMLSMKKTSKRLDMELKKEKQSRTIVRQLMKLTVDGRHQDKQPLVDEILMHFPALKDHKTEL